ncbi:MAG: hypothetical protein JNL41_09620 [Phenylobacterium sp.]|uniref:GumC family protein n=1 Tax=Phenylobacterium sp. TaxID=1871053 RepID=UPI001A58442B|nr:Wzz/FepE/Etk N-terminal domain-containing protein [Phenylobacterium sp.]MBL8554524.1 hypothetical protein [Phenylobacterium sp.]
MKLGHIFDVLWGRRVVILASTLACLAGGLTVQITSVPRYEASARVILDYVKPDPVTGAQVPNKMLNAYVNSQLSFIRDYQVAIPAVESLGMMDNPDLLDAYNALPDGKPEYPMWVAQRIMGALNAVPVEDSSILEIRYRAPDPQAAKVVVEAVREAYVQGTIAQRAISSQAGADNLMARAEKVSAELKQAQDRQTALEKSTGIVMQEGKKFDVDSARLKQMLRLDGRSYVSQPYYTAASVRLAEAESALTEARRVLGPNNPALKTLEAQRDQLKLNVDRIGSGDQQMAAMVATRDRLAAQLADAQKSKVLSQRVDVMKLRLMQDEIDGYTFQINEMLKQAAELRQMSTAKETSITPLGPASAKPKPVFPNPLLILGGSGALGLVLGVLIAGMTELMARRVRRAEDLQVAAEAPLFGQIPTAPQVRRRAAAWMRRRPWRHRRAVAA